jgi:hypothetical protein
MKCCPSCHFELDDVHQEVFTEDASYEHGDVVQYEVRFPDGLPGDLYCGGCRQYFWYEEVKEQDTLELDITMSR